VRAGNAALLAANDVRGQLFPFVAERLEASVDDLVAADRRIWVKGNPDRGMSLNDALQAYQYADNPLPIVGRGAWIPPTEQPTSLLTKNGNFSPSYSFMTQAAEVEVDTEMGKVKVIKMVTAHDRGQPINPMLVEGQLEGSIMGGMGQALYEDSTCIEGQQYNPSFLDYGLPLSWRCPRSRPFTSIPMTRWGLSAPRRRGRGRSLHRPRPLSTPSPMPSAWSSTACP